MKSVIITISLCVMSFVAGYYVKNIDVVASNDTNVSKKYIQPVPKEDYEGQALITFSYDDGYESTYSNALPLHVKNNLPATFNIIAQNVYLDNDYFMNDEMIKDSHKKGIEIGSHSITHPFLSKMKIEQVREELLGSKNLLETLVGSVDTFAVPYSDYNEEIKALTKEMYKGARVFDKDTNRLDNYDKYWLKSKAVTNKTTLDEVKKWIDDAIEEKSWLIIMLHGITENKEEEYEITPVMLEQIIGYVKGKDKSELLPVNTKEGIVLTEQWDN